jgi:hypothetical protein
MCTSQFAQEFEEIPFLQKKRSRTASYVDKKESATFYAAALTQKVQQRLTRCSIILAKDYVNPKVRKEQRTFTKQGTLHRLSLIEIRCKGSLRRWEGRGCNASDGNQEVPEAGICLRLGVERLWELAILRRTGQSIIDGFVRSPSVPRVPGLRFTLALLNSRGARRRSRFNRVNHCSVLLRTPHSSRLVRPWRIHAPCPACGGRVFCCAVYLGDFLRKHHRVRSLGQPFRQRRREQRDVCDQQHHNGLNHDDRQDCA